MFDRNSSRSFTSRYGDEISIGSFVNYRLQDSDGVDFQSRKGEILSIDFKTKKVEIDDDSEVEIFEVSFDDVEDLVIEKHNFPDMSEAPEEC